MASALSEVVRQPPLRSEPDVNDADIVNQAAGSGSAGRVLAQFLSEGDNATREPTASEQAYCGNIQVPRDFLTLEKLVKDTREPHCKAELWATGHRERVASDAQRDAVRVEGDLHLSAMVAERRNETLREIDEELADLHSRDNLSEADVDAVVGRKEDEYALEIGADVNVKNKKRRRPDGSRIVWMREELAQIRWGLNLLPPALIGNNLKLTSIERSDFEPRLPKASASYDAVYGTACFYDSKSAAAERAATAQKLDEASPAQLDAKFRRADDVVHEVAHSLQKHPRWEALYEEYVRIAGWQTDISLRQLQTQAGFSESTIKKLQRDRDKEERDEDKDGEGKDGEGKDGEGKDGEGKDGEGKDGEGKDGEGKDGEVEGADGLIYRADPDNEGKVNARKQGLMPLSRRWSYAKNGPGELFAEHARMAVITPVQLFDDLIAAPAKDLAEALVRRDSAKVAVTNARSAAAKARKVRMLREAIDELGRDLLRAEAEVAAARDVQAAWSGMYDIMRHILGGAAATSEAVERLQAKHVDPSRILDFMRRAERLSTQPQVAALEAAVDPY